MRRQLVTLLAAVALGAISQGVAAADLPARPEYKAPAVVPVVANWTGVYGALGGGYGVYNADTTSNANVLFPGPGAITTDNGRAGGRGWFGTAQIGADWQFADRWVVGIFGDYDFSSIEGTVGELSGTGIVPLKQTSAWSAGGRIGFLVVPQLLTYYSGGYTSARFEMGQEIRQSAPVGAFSGVTWPDQDFSGYFIGSGLEYMIFPGWFVKTEYRYASYSAKTVTGAISIPPASPLLTSINMTVKPQVQTIRTELVYKFNWMR
jgi:outer membrane immunogenic protein